MRSATPADKPRVCLLMERMHEELLRLGGQVRPGQKTSAWVGRCFDLALDGAGAALVEERDGEVIGASVAVAAELPYDATAGERQAFGIGTYVDPSYRKYGVASALYEAMKAELRARGFDAYLGGCLPGNTAIQGVLERVGFEVTEVSVVCRLGGRSCPQS